MAETNVEYLNRYMEVFQEKVDMTRRKRKEQRMLIEQLAKINCVNKDLERKNQNLERDLLNETRRQVEKKLVLDDLRA